jgi:hypothetical protein
MRRATERGIPVLIATLAPPSSLDILRLPVWRESVRDSVAEVNQRLRRYGSQSGVDIVDFSAALRTDDRRTPDKFRTYRALDGFENRLADRQARALTRKRIPPHLQERFALFLRLSCSSAPRRTS